MVFINHLLNRDRSQRAEKLLQEFIDRHWSEDLVELYGRLEMEDVTRQLKAAEFWLQSHPQDSVLLLTLARLSPAATNCGARPAATSKRASVWHRQLPPIVNWVC